MTVKRLFAVGFIFCMTAVAWFLLGSSVLVRSGVKNRDMKRVGERWGSPQAQKPPTIRNTDTNSLLTPESSDLRVDLKLDYRRLGLLWYSTYTVTFDGVYEVKNADALPVNITVVFEPPVERPAEDGGPAGPLRLDDFTLEEVGAPARGDGATTLRLGVPPGESKKVHLHYKSQGLGYWQYVFGDNVEHIRNFKLAATTDFRNVDFTTLSPTEPKVATANGWELTWKYDSTRAKGLTVTIDMPERQNPGELAWRVTFFAPVALLFFFTVMVVITVMKKVDVHPMNYFFIAAAFFAFHLLLSYLVDHIDVHAAFFISAAASVFLVVSYLRLVTGMRFALVEAGLSQLVFLVGFSYAFFYEGFTGLAVTIGSVITLFVLMQVTGRVRWDDVFKSSPPPATPWQQAPPPAPRP